MFTSKMIILSQNLYWNSKQNNPPNKINLLEGNFYHGSELVYAMRCLLDVRRKVIKNFNSKIKGIFLESCYVCSWSM
jgi:hypothetical protein